MVTVLGPSSWNGTFIVTNQSTSGILMLAHVINNVLGSELGADEETAKAWLAAEPGRAAPPAPALSSRRGVECDRNIGCEWA